MRCVAIRVVKIAKRVKRKENKQIYKIRKRLLLLGSLFLL